MFNILRTFAITDTISNFVEPYITQATDFLGGLAPWMAAVILLGVAIFTLVGIIVFIKKFIKLFLVLAIIGGILYVLYTQGILNGILETIGLNIVGIFTVV
ncbi:hypothetical protein ACAG96_05720 [Candidatus Izemoplasma sp. B36]|uniref:hypothetical protein n=1 Tax=Candidatus Izemoplasma sp. B36 TaxID=3242468 RepID=UPI0035567443